jgi:HSP20 family protein
MAGKRAVPRGVSRLMSERDRQARPAGEAPGENLAGGIGQFFTKLAEAAEALGTARDGVLQRHGEMPLNLGGKQGRAVFGYTLRMGLDGVRAERFGDAVPAAGQPQQRGAAPRAPIIDIFEDAEDVRIVAELPGVDVTEITCTLNGSKLCIATRGAVRYEKTVELPAPVAPDSLRQSCLNGILEVRLRRAVAP